MKNTTLIVLLGAPGSGKGTVAQYITKKYNVCYFSTGNLLRNEVKKKSDMGCKVESILGSGGLVSDDIVNEIVEKNLRGISEEYGAVVLDGYPRTKKQALMLECRYAPVPDCRVQAILLNVAPEEIISRISQRTICDSCGSAYGPSQRKTACACGGALVRRKDDEEVVVRHRLEEYEREIEPLLAYYADKLIEIDGADSLEGVAAQVEAHLRSLGIEERR
ncbi:MAG: nucleoside monophosphate kinase [Holosporaceae bacterium]|jgi:adenylate kinase|nr:nucleoside monophosphate kinase [Holosporaceae bacterium]